MSEEFSVVREPYLLLTFIPFSQDDDGRIWLDVAWHKDFERHLTYLKHLTLVAPKIPLEDGPQHIASVSVPGDVHLEIAPLRQQRSATEALLNLPNTIRVLWKTIGNAKIVHSGIVGWPFPLGWTANPIALLRRKKLILFVESAPWRITTPGPHSIKKRFMSWITERIGRFYMRRADLAVVTHPGYLELLGDSKNRHRGFVNPASWIDEKDVLSTEQLDASWLQKRSGSVKALFAGRLTKEKGVSVLLDAMELLTGYGISIHLDIIGDGSEKERCRVFADGHSNVRLLETVRYGEEFFSLLRRYHMVIVPSLSDEQPRILFDAFSQGIPVVASRTRGIGPFIDDGSDSWGTEPGSASQLADAMRSAAIDITEAERRGRSAHRKARSMTHRNMHAKRSRIIRAMLDGTDDSLA